MTLHVQFQTMGWMLACGLLIGAIFDLYRVLAGELRIPRWLYPPIDLAYWGFATLLVFRVLFYSNFGQVRLFVFIGLFAGAALYFTAFSATAVKIIRWLIMVVKKLIWFGKRTIEIVIIAPIRGLYKLITIILGFLAALAIFLCKIVLQLLYPVRLLSRFVYRKIRPYIRWPKRLVSAWNRFKRWLRR